MQSRLTVVLATAGVALCSFANLGTAAQINTAYSFCSQANCADGAYPGAGLLAQKGVLYGTTSYGGTGPSICGGPGGCGSVFEFDGTTGVEKVLYSFCPNGYPCTDGSIPASSLVEVNGFLYGTTSIGVTEGCGGTGCGTVFSVDEATGIENVLYSFTGGVDGYAPATNLVAIKGTLYGVVNYGGANNAGAVFSVNLESGAESNVYSFCSLSNCSDGTQPAAALITMGGELYGTTGRGGQFGEGTVYSVDPKTNKEKVLHSFGSGSDGQWPTGAPLEANGMLLGTTRYGGSDNFGTIFSLDPSDGSETVLHSFFCTGRKHYLKCRDGIEPYSGLALVGDKLYGATEAGGSHKNGVLYSFDLSSGIEKLLYTFPDYQSQPVPEGMVNLGGALYSVTMQSGTSGDGSIFYINP